MSISIASRDPQLAALLDSNLAKVELRLRESVSSDYDFVVNASRHLIDAGGKRFRPLLTLLAAEFGSGVNPNVIDAAVVVELTHLATLFHDDVMDEAQRRRGVPSANARWDNSVAILTGDYLFAKASQLLADLGPEAVRIQAETFERLVTGQIMESVGPKPNTDPVEFHLQVLAGKTGSLIATAGRFGAMFGQAEPEVVHVLSTFGEHIGVAFQLADDIVDLTSVADESGKTQGTDLREGILTLPSLLALQESGSTHSRLSQLLSRPLPDDDEHAEALALLLGTDAIERARLVAQSWAEEARADLAKLPDISARRELEALCDFVVTRSN